jgi:hypothetical protein
MEREDLDRMGRELDELVRAHLPSGVQRVALLQYGDDPAVEPGELMVKVLIEAADGPEGEQALDGFGQRNRPALKELRREVEERFSEVRRLEITIEGTAGEPQRGHLGLWLGRPQPARVREAGELTPVMARLGPVDLETLDALITAGIAANRAEAVRWALARIRERPAYAQLRDRIREIDELKAQF